MASLSTRSEVAARRRALSAGPVAERGPGTVQAPDPITCAGAVFSAPSTLE